MPIKKRRQRTPLLRFFSEGDNRIQLSAFQTLLTQIAEQALTRRQWDCVCAYYLEQLPQADIAQRLGINVSTVSRHIKTGKQHLQRRVEECLQAASFLTPTGTSP